MMTTAEILKREELGYSDWRKHDEFARLGEWPGTAVAVVSLCDEDWIPGVDYVVTTQVVEEAESQGAYEAPVYHYTPLEHGPLTRKMDAIAQSEW